MVRGQRESGFKSFMPHIPNGYMIRASAGDPTYRFCAYHSVGFKHLNPDPILPRHSGQSAGSRPASLEHTPIAAPSRLRAGFVGLDAPCGPNGLF